MPGITPFLGVRSDSFVARTAGVSRGVAARWRREAGYPDAAGRPGPAPTREPIVWVRLQLLRLMQLPVDTPSAADLRALARRLGISHQRIHTVWTHGATRATIVRWTKQLAAGGGAG